MTDSRVAVVVPAVIALCLACAGNPAPPPSAPAPNSPPEAPAAAISSRRGQLAAATGLPPLWENPGAVRGREIRIAYLPTTYVWEAFSLLRLVELDGRWNGELYLYWGTLNDSTGRPLTPPWRRTCTTLASIASLVDGFAYCPVPSWHVSWQAVADTLEALGAWNLVGQGGVVPLRQVTTPHQDVILVEGVVGGRYGSHEYYGPALVGDSASRVLSKLGDVVVLLTRQRQFR